MITESDGTVRLTAAEALACLNSTADPADALIGLIDDAREQAIREAADAIDDALRENMKDGVCGAWWEARARRIATDAVRSLLTKDEGSDD